MAGAVKRQKIKAKFTDAADQGGGWHFLVIERAVVDKFAFEGKAKRVKCSINGTDPFQCALMPWGEIHYILVNKLRRTELGLNVGDIVDVTLEKDDSKYGLPMPEEFREILDQDPDGDKLFHALTAGKQRSILYQVAQPKDIDRRIHTGLIFIEHLKKNDGKVISDQLAEELKRPIF